MKKILSLALAVLMLVSAVPMVYAADVDYTNGTAVTYTATGSESYTVTVPAQLAPGGNGTVTLSGTWADNRIVTVTADPTVTLTNSIKAEDQKVLNVNFNGISEVGSNTGSQTFTESVSVSAISDALFGTWSGSINYNVNIAGSGSTSGGSIGGGSTTTPTLISFTIGSTSYQAEEGITWEEWICGSDVGESSGYYLYSDYVLNGKNIVTYNGTPVTKDSYVVENATYSLADIGISHEFVYPEISEDSANSAIIVLDNSANLADVLNEDQQMVFEAAKTDIDNTDSAINSAMSENGYSIHEFFYAKTNTTENYEIIMTIPNRVFDECMVWVYDCDGYWKSPDFTSCYAYLNEDGTVTLNIHDGAIAIFTK